MEGAVVHSTSHASSETLNFDEITAEKYSQWFFKEIVVNKHGGKASYVNMSASARRSPTWQMPRCAVPWGINYSKASSDKDTPAADDESAAAAGGGGGGSGGGSAYSTTEIQPGKKATCDLDITSNAGLVSWTKDIDSHILNVAAANSKKWFNRVFDASKLQMVYRELAPEPKEESYKILFRTKVPWYPRDPTSPYGRFAGLLAADGSIEETNAYAPSGSVIPPDPVNDRESHFYYLVKNSSGETEYCDKVPIVKSNGDPVTCARSGRAMYRYLSPLDVKPNFEVEPIVELNSLWFTNKQFGCTVHIQHAIVYPTTTSKKPTFKIGGAIVREASRVCEDDMETARKFVAPSVGATAAAPAAAPTSTGPKPSDLDDF
jgi:hypothetical protein